MRIALVNPPVAHRYVPGIDEPLHLEYLAAQVRDEHEVLLVDALGMGFTAEQTVEHLREACADIVGVSLGFTAAWTTTRAICAGIKAACPDVLTLVGGNTATFLARDLAQLPEVDVVVRGEADISFRLLIDALDRGDSLRDIDGLTYRLDNKLVETPDRSLIADLEALPFPARDLLPYAEQYRKVVLTARGCPYGCIYCSTSAFWQRRFRPRSVPSILEEVRLLLSDRTVDYFAFADDCFTLVRDRVLQICEGLQALGHQATWSCTGRIETATSEVLERMSQAGCRNIFFGAESGSDRVLRTIGRKYGAADVQRAYRDCLANGIQPSFSFIVGLPSETEQDLQQTFQLIESLDGVENGVHVLTPFPGTPITMHPEKFGIRILPHRVEDLDINTRSFIETRNASSDESEANFKKGLGYCFRALRRSRNKSAVLG